jgi:hypothetical protein
MFNDTLFAAFSDNSAQGRQRQAHDPFALKKQEPFSGTY